MRNPHGKEFPLSGNASTATGKPAAVTLPLACRYCRARITRDWEGRQQDRVNGQLTRLINDTGIALHHTVQLRQPVQGFGRSEHEIATRFEAGMDAPQNVLLYIC